MRARVEELTPAERAAASAAAQALLIGQPSWRDAASVMFYAPLPSELDLWPLAGAALAAGKLLALPRFVPEINQYEPRQICDLETDLLPGRFGIREPREQCPQIPINRLDFILVPGVAFDLHGRRLGRGKGYYDRMLAVVCGKSCGVAFDEQILREIPVEPHDIFVNCILTPTRWLAVGPRAALE
jgi:5-formyltetrahydrofolate cyclo-ligase